MSLEKIPKYNDNSSIKILSDSLKQLRAVKKIAPGAIKDELAREIDEVKYLIEDKKEDENFDDNDWKKTLKILRKYALKMWPIIDKHACFSNVGISGITEPATIT